MFNFNQVKVMKKSRRKFDSAFKAKVAVEALKERQTLSELAVKFDLHPNQISQWRQEFLENSAVVFEQKPKLSKSENAVDVDKLYSKIGELQMEKDFLKKSLAKLGL
jgi:transposase